MCCDSVPLCVDECVTFSLLVTTGQVLSVVVTKFM